MESIQVIRGAQVKPVPAVSIIIPAYNTAHLIAEALDSVFAQTYQDFETIVINDGSPDTEALDRVLQSYLPRIVYIKQPNRRASGARNTGIREARGEYLAFLDSDEYWRREFLASQMGLFEQIPPPDMVYADALYTPDSGRPPGETWMWTCPSRGPCTLDSLLREDCHIGVSSVVARKRAIVDAGLFDETLPCLDDLDMWLRVACRGGKISYQTEPLAYSRADRPGSLSQNKINEKKMLVRIFSKLAETPMAPAAREALNERIQFEQAMLNLTQGKIALLSRSFAQASESLKAANSYFQRRRIKLVLAGLRLAPEMTRSGAIAWERLLMQVHRWRTRVRFSFRRAQQSQPASI